jgi:hypothetical protein
MAFDADVDENASAFAEREGVRLVEEGKCEERLETPLMKMTKSKPQTPSNTLDCEINRNALRLACSKM